MEKHTVSSIQRKKKDHAPIVALTCYDASTAGIIDQCGVDIALVGDSLANTRLGYPNTLPVTVDEMLHHVRASSRGIAQALLVADMPFQSYEVSPPAAVKAAGRFIKEGRAKAVKVEGGKRIGDSIRSMLKANIPVMGHLGLTPQSVNLNGGYRVHGKEAGEARHIMEEAKFLEKLGVFALVLECVPEGLARKITKALKIPTIGIGAGAYCDGQILVLDDLLGFSSAPSPKFVKKYADLRPAMLEAVRRYATEVRHHRFPTDEQTYH